MIAYDSDGERRRSAEPRGLDLDLVLNASGEGDDSSVTLRSRFERTYFNSFTYLDFTRRCRPTGELERAIFARLQQP